PVSYGEQYLRHFSNGLVTHGTKDHRKRPLAAVRRKGRAQGPGTGGIMCHVQHEFGGSLSGWNELKPAGPASFANAALDGFSSNWKTLIVQFLGGRYRQSNVPQLMPPNQRRFDRDLFAEDLQRIPRNIRSSVFLRVLCVLGGECACTSIFGSSRSWRNRRNERYSADGACILLENGTSNDGISLRHLRQSHNWTARPDDACFLPGDLSDSVAEELLVVERDVGDDADARLDHVCRVETPTHTDLENSYVDLLTREMLEGHGGQHLEKAGMPWQFALFDQAFGITANQLVQEREIIVADCFSVDSNPFIDPDQVRRGVQAGTQTGSAEDGCQRRRS